MNEPEGTEFKRLGVNVLLDKPFTQEKLVEALKTVSMKQISETSPPSSDVAPTASVATITTYRMRDNLTTILGRTAAYKRTEVTWDKMLRANEKWTADLKGLKA